MPDGDTILPAMAQSVMGKSLLFPISPQPGETLLGFLVRSVDHNYLPGPCPILSELEVDLRLKGDCLGRLATNVPLLAEILGQRLEDVRRLWGGEAMSGGRRRLGGVWLRPHLIFSSHRRLPRKLLPGTPDRALWMVRHLGFCPESWEILVERCPRPWCGKRLTWSSANALHLCAWCGAGVGEAKRRIVPAKDRPALQWLVGLFDDDDEVVEQALKRLPPIFELESATETYELLIALAKPMQLFRGVKNSRAVVNLVDVARACRHLLEFPRSNWDLQQLERDVRSDFRERLERVAQHSTQPAVQREARRLLDYGRARARSKAVRILPLRWLSLTESAAMIGVERGDVRRLVDAGLVTANDGGGGRQRQHSVLQRREVERIKTRIRERMSWRAFCHASGLPKIAIEQMLAADLLRPKDDPLVTELFGDRQLERRSAELLLERARKVSQDDESDWVPLSHAMRGVGGREKPWARVIQAGFDGDLPGGFRCDEAKPGMLHLKVHPITARRLIMGGPSALTPFDFQPGDLGEYWRLDLTPGEVELHLNCTAQDVTWLRSRKLISPNNEKGTPTSYARPDVEALGREYITTREIAARLDLKAKDVWQSLQGLAVGGAVGQGFYRRDAVETLLEKFERSSRS